MKKPLIIILFCMLYLALHAQPMYNQPRKGIPDFDLIQIDGSHLKASNLLKGQPLMIVYFDPDCDHCVMFITELLQKMDAFKNVQIVMVTYVPVRTVRNFVNNMGISKFTGIKIGTEGSNFIVRYHYDVVQFPYLALHDKNGNLFATFESEVPAPEELAVLFSNK